MTRIELAKLYERSTVKTGRPPDQSELRGWWTTLGAFAVEDVEEALANWWSGSRFLPAARELVTSAMAARNRRTMRGSETKILVGWHCEKCGRIQAGFILPSDRNPRFCIGFPRGVGHRSASVCGAEMREVHRDVAEARQAPDNLVAFHARSGKQAAAGDY